MTPKEIVKKYEGQGYGKFKTDLADLIIEDLSKFQKKYSEIMNNKEKIDEILLKGAENARKKTSRMLDKVYRKVGFLQIN